MRHDWTANGFSVLCALLLIGTGCGKRESTQPSDVNAEKDRLFFKKVECGKLLAHLEGSFLGPEIREKKGILPANPVVFYSPSLNTCLYINRYYLYGNTIGSKGTYNKAYASVEDLLTGRTIESHEFNRKVPNDVEADSKFEDQVISRYGPQQ